MLTTEDMKRILHKKLDGGKKKEFAHKHNFSEAFLNMVLTEKRDITDRLAKAMGYVRKVMYRKK